jgi:hypothetical protein
MPICRIMSRVLLLAASVTALAVSAVVHGQEQPKRLEIWDIRLGTAVAQLPDDFVDYACGTNGGPPGLREVYFRYDDELEYWAKANDLLGQMEQYAGTKTYGFPIVASLLIDAGGIVKGIRIVSDPRNDADNRDEAYLLKNFLTARFGRDNWTCEKLAPEAGETPVDGVFVKERCRKDIDGETAASLATRYLRKAGQTRFDPHSGKQTAGQFDSTVRFELVRSK